MRKLSLQGLARRNRMPAREAFSAGNALRITYHSIAALMLVTYVVPAGAQTRIRRIAQFTSGYTTISISAEGGSVVVQGRRLVETPAAAMSPGEAREWVDAVRTLANARFRPAAGEELRQDTSTEAMFAHLSATRIATRSRDIVHVIVMNSVEAAGISMSHERLAAFLRALLQAAEAGDQMNGALPAPGVLPGDTPPAPTRGSLQEIRDSLGLIPPTTPLRLEVVIGPDGRPEPANAYFLGGRYANTYNLKTVVPRLRFTPGVHAGRPARMRARVVIADTGRAALQRTPRITTEAYLTNQTEVADALSRAYPRALRRAHIGGRVIIDIMIDEAGQPDITVSRVVESTHEELSQAALRVLPVMKFSPAILDDGRTTKSTVRMPFDFTP